MASCVASIDGLKSDIPDHLHAVWVVMHGNVRLATIGKRVSPTTRITADIYLIDT